MNGVFSFVILPLYKILLSLKQRGGVSLWYFFKQNHEGKLLETFFCIYSATTTNVGCSFLNTSSIRTWRQQSQQVAANGANSLYSADYGANTVTW